MAGQAGALIESAVAGGEKHVMGTRRSILDQRQHGLCALAIEAVADRREKTFGDVARLRCAEPLELGLRGERPGIGDLLSLQIDDPDQIAARDAEGALRRRRDDGGIWIRHGGT